MAHSTSRRKLIVGTAALGLHGLTSRARAADRPLADRLAAYADSLRYDDLDSATVERVKSHVIDTLGCGIAAFHERPVRVCREIALTHSGVASIIGTKRRATTDLAAFANGAAFRYYDLNDIYVARFTGHPSDHIAACLAVAEAERASAAELITAIVLAYEINCRLIDTLDIGSRGWDPPALSLPAVALAAGKLMKLTLDQLIQAVNIAVNDHSPWGRPGRRPTPTGKASPTPKPGVTLFSPPLWRAAASPARAPSSKDGKASSSWSRGLPMSMLTASAGAASRSGSISAA
jgi:2-methylcitrate dehydratase